MNDKERREWVMNDESLYRVYQRSKLGLYCFVNRFRKQITNYIEAELRGVDVKWEEPDASKKL